MLILGALVQQCQGQPAQNCPFMEPLKESPVCMCMGGAFDAQAGRSQGRGCEVLAIRGICLRTAVHWQNYEISQGLGEETNICSYSLILFTVIPFGERGKRGSKKIL